MTVAATIVIFWSCLFSTVGSTCSVHGSSCHMLYKVDNYIIFNFTIRFHQLRCPGNEIIKATTWGPRHNNLPRMVALIRMDHYFLSELLQNQWRTHVLYRFLRRTCFLHRFSMYSFLCLEQIFLGVEQSFCVLTVYWEDELCNCLLWFSSSSSWLLSIILSVKCIIPVGTRYCLNIV